MDNTRRIDYEGFLQKYRCPVIHEYILGYYAHLIADDLWLKGVYLPWLRNRMAHDNSLQALYHHDFQLLNGKLLEHYQLSKKLKQLFSTYPSTIVDLDEVKALDVEKFVPYVVGDMQYDRTSVEEDLNVFTLDQIIGYIETSIELAKWRIKSLI